MKYALRDDYSEGCHPDILKKLAETNFEQCPAYGADRFSKSAEALLCAEMGTTDTPIYFVSGGTVANLIINSALLRAHEAVIAPTSGHIETNETGAIEATGHKIHTVEHVDGKLTANKLSEFLKEEVQFPKMPRPRTVYISNATEIGTVYRKSEIADLSKVCEDNGLYLMLDGARLAYGLASEQSDLTMADLAQYTDVFWFGGTKIGALYGEAVIFPNKDLAEDFTFHLKQRGTLLAKGRALGIQFETLLKDSLYLDLASHANGLASKIAEAIQLAGHNLVADVQANMIFANLPNALINHLRDEFEFHIWKKVDAERTTVRLLTSWATDEAQVDRFIAHLRSFH